MMIQSGHVAYRRTPQRLVVGGVLALLYEVVLAQASPFQTGAMGLLAAFTAIATPIAIILVMVLGVVAMSGRISWGWPLAVLIGIGVMFGAPQLVGWVRSLFAV